MRVRAVRRGLPIVLALGLCAAWPVAATAEPVSGPHQIVDNQFTTTQPGAPTGFSYEARYHAENDPSGDPPYMEKMISYQPPGLRFDTSVPKRCTASDLELALQGVAACPPGSKLGGGTTTTKFMGEFPSTTDVDLFNNKDEQIILARSPVITTVARGRIHPDGSVEFASPTCYPSVPGASCPADNVLQLGSSIKVAPYTRTSAGRTRSYMTTPPDCPATGYWETPIRFWWADGSVDTVVTRQPCTA